MRADRFATLIVLAIATPATAQDRAPQDRAPATQRVYLSGQGLDDAVPWQFTIDKGMRAGERTTIPVPSNWQQQGFGHYQYGYDRGPRSNDRGTYRRQFEVPADWKGKSVRLVFDGVMTDALVTVNGTPAGPVHQGGFSRFGFNVTALLKPGRNEVEVAVSEASAAKDTDVAERWGDYWAMSGIFRPVWLEIAPAESIAAVAADARADGGIAVEATLAAPRTATRVTAQVVARDGRPAGAPFAAALPAGGAGRVRLAGRVEAPLLWSAETPNLYDLDVTLWAGGTPLHRVRTRIGFRTFEIREGDGLYLNGRRILLKGVNRHSFRPATGRTLSRADAYADARAIRDLNMNAVRTSHYTPEEAFLEAADELGLYVIDELTGWQHAHGTEVGRLLVRELVERDRNHPSILLWTNGNEGGWNRALDGDFALYDIQRRPVLHPWELYGGVDTKHYPRYPDLIRRLSGPSLVMPTEFLHGLYDGGGGAGLDDYWRAIAGSPRGAGGFLWNYADEGIARTDRGGAIDVAATLAPDGIVGPAGEKEPSWWTVRDVWSPVQFADPVIGPGFDGRLRVTNGFDFTPLDGIAFDWRWVRFADPSGGVTRTLASGTVRGAAVAPGATGTVAIPVPPAGADALALSVRQGTRELIGRVWPVTPARAAGFEAAAGGMPRVERVGGTVRLVAGAARAEIDAATGLLTALRRGRTAAALAGGPRLVLARPPMDKSEPVFIATAPSAGIYRPPAPQMANVVDVDTVMTAEDGWGGFTLQVSPDGAAWTTVFTGQRTARDGSRYPFAPQRVAAVRLIDLTGSRRSPAIRGVRLGWEAARFAGAGAAAPVTLTSGTGRDPATGAPVAWVDAPGAGGLGQVRWTMDTRGTLSLDYRYALNGPMLYHGVGFDAPGGYTAATGLLRGPTPVWQNRMRGPILGVHRVAATGVAGLPAPAAAGYFADPRWLRLQGRAGTLVVRNAGGAPLVQIGARLADLPSTSVDFPHADLGFLAAIPSMGAKFQAADTTGPAGLPAAAAGEYRGRLLFDVLPPVAQRP